MVIGEHGSAGPSSLIDRARLAVHREMNEISRFFLTGKPGFAAFSRLV
jgi:hypothetical protein